MSLVITGDNFCLQINLSHSEHQERHKVFTKGMNSWIYLRSGMDTDFLKLLIIIAGAGHIALCFGSLLIPKVLQWEHHLSNLQPLLRQMFWTYAAYILVINFCFGIVSLLGTDELLNGSFLASCITIFISIYWLTRVGIQFFYFDKTDAPKGVIYTLGEAALVLLFIFFTIVYLLAFLYNNAWI